MYIDSKLARRQLFPAAISRSNAARHLSSFAWQHIAHIPLRRSGTKFPSRTTSKPVPEPAPQPATLASPIEWLLFGVRAWLERSFSNDSTPHDSFLEVDPLRSSTTWFRSDSATYDSTYCMKDDDTTVVILMIGSPNTLHGVLVVNSTDLPHRLLAFDLLPGTKVPGRIIQEAASSRGILARILIEELGVNGAINAVPQCALVLFEIGSLAPQARRPPKYDFSLPETQTKAKPQMSCCEMANSLDEYESNGPSTEALPITIREFRLLRDLHPSIIISRHKPCISDHMVVTISHARTRRGVISPIGLAPQRSRHTPLQWPLSHSIHHFAPTMMTKKYCADDAAPRDVVV
ncbi:hypothetical protein FPV67DRAFT_1444757 [Lyophyllum atratum]|nr:hypothetical protein FPV67DRAFT_1444757 [Lyophyllum atratum]